ncbi:MAG: TlyA family RNA methyltransferase [Candidatus Bipolaricaulota bacterium]
MLLVASGFTASRSRAQALIRAGRVRVDGKLVDKPGTRVSTSAQLGVHTPPRYVSRGGEKLEAALSAFDLDPGGLVCLDVGASTGGFTDCLLQHGAARVYAVDVGKGLLDWKLRNDPRVVVREGLNARYLDTQHIPEAVALAAVDVAFISLRLVLPPIEPLLNPKGEVLALVKPQFEAGRSQVRRGGVVWDPQVHLEVLESLRTFVAEKLGWAVSNAVASPLPGPAGNLEFFLRLSSVREESTDADLDFTTLVNRAHSQLARSPGSPAQRESEQGGGSAAPL